jgi:peptidoglycan/LPS O-acetylase OafA/YrhL
MWPMTCLMKNYFGKWLNMIRNITIATLTTSLCFTIALSWALWTGKLQTTQTIEGHQVGNVALMLGE